MHILLVRDAQSPVRQIEVTPRRVVMSLLVVTFLLMVLNLGASWLLQALGLQSESVTAAQTLSESMYERKLIELESQIGELNARLKGLDATRQQIIQGQPQNNNPETPLPLAAPPGSAPQNPGHAGGQGGPMLRAPGFSSDLSYLTRLHQLESAALDLQAHSQQVGQQLVALQAYQAATPTGYPLPYQAQMTSAPGFRMDPFTGQSSWHAGTDYAAYPGTPILSTGDGYVIRAEWDSEFGNLVEISHPGVNMVTRYAHADQLYVKPGQRVLRGEVIASVGSTGRSTGPHLHYEIR
jgi:murein DD-endopeptidase MepM/ murein hydrolase activator NlpD